MRTRIAALTACIATLAGLIFWSGITAQENTAAPQGGKKNAFRVLPAAKSFLQTLGPDEKNIAVLGFDAASRVKWHFIPMETRKGLPIMDMKAEQKEAALKLLRSVLSKVGYEKATKIMALEGVLRQLEGPGSEARRNPEKYYFTFFGTPKQKQRWGLSVEGHHLSLNFVFEGSKVLDSTPQFFAANPAELKEAYGEGFPKGLRVLKAEEQLGFALVKSLDDAQLAKAMLPGETPDEIRDAGEPQPSTLALPGLSASEMSQEQKVTLQKLLRSYTSKMKPVVAKKRWKLIEEHGMEQIKFSWSGAKRPGVGHYYVVQGPSFLVEFINVQPDAAGNPANHIHCVWRDMQGDFDLPLAAK